MKIILILLLSLISCFLSSAQLPLTLNHKLSKTILTGDAQQFTIKIQKNHFYKLLVIQNGIDVEVRVKFPGGYDSIFNARNDTLDSEPIEFFALSSGVALITLAPPKNQWNTLQGQYSIEFLQELDHPAYNKLLKQQEVEEKEFVNWIKTNAFPLQSITPGNSFEDLAALKPILMNKKVVALGESTHGTREFFQMKHRMFEFMVRELGFNMIAFEGSFARLKYANEFILTGNGNLDSAIAIQGADVLRTEEVKELFNWMRTYNSTNPERKIQITGFDMQGYEPAAIEISSYFKKVDPTVNSRLDSILKKIIKYFKVRDSLPALVPPLINEFINFTQRQGEYVLKSSVEEYKKILWDFKILHQFLQSYKPGRLAGSRDQYMAQNIFNYLIETADTKIVLWAHNGHLAKSYRSLGSYLKKELKDDYYVIAFDFYKGKFQAFDLDEKKWMEQEMGEAPAGHISSYFLQAGLENAFLDFTSPIKNKNIYNWLNEKEIGIYGIGSTFSKKNKPSYYIGSARFNRSFDAVIFIKETTSAKPTKNIIITFDF